MNPTTITNGWHEGVPMADYLAVGALSSSGLKAMARSPEHFRSLSTDPIEPTADMILGSAIHMSVLEPHLFTDHYVVEPPREEWGGKTRNAKRYREAVKRLTADGRELLTIEQWDACMGVADKLIDPETEEIRTVLGQPHDVEITGFYDGWDIPIKIRPDWMSRIGRRIVDLKTTKDASVDAFQRTIVNFKYHMGAALYVDVARSLGVEIDTYSFLAIEKTPPYAMALYDLDAEAMDIGRMEYGPLLAKASVCHTTNNWPSYPNGPISLPRWYTRRIEEAYV